MHVGSSIITKRFERSNASTGQIATQAAQPKQRPSSSERISPARLGIGWWKWLLYSNPPRPLHFHWKIWIWKKKRYNVCFQFNWRYSLRLYRYQPIAIRGLPLEQICYHYLSTGNRGDPRHISRRSLIWKESLAPLWCSIHPGELRHIQMRRSTRGFDYIS